MAKKSTILIEGTILLIVLVAILTVLSISMESYTLPEGFADNESVEQSNGFFIKNQIIRYPAKANVSILNISDKNIKIGVAPQTYELNFGNVPQNITVRKFIQFANNENVPVKVCFVARGSISPLVKSTEGREMILQSQQQREIEITFNSTEVGLYNGEMDIVIRKPESFIPGSLISLVRC